ncbi:protein tesmin/TSO1-like CXC 2 isoform X2 [Tasmannia lanceolata]|uniref:protein tesmin/TSO1-like CXC 2 isoform X2 n=1 Tax=Tasmannia lanceolata TaxID=3420 RepID=UPI004064BC10
MDTPDRNQIGTPVAKFEDSPVFNYLNSLSPIKPVKSVHITQTFHSLSFASIPSVFTSPIFSSQRESRFLKRNEFADPSKAGVSSDDGDEAKISMGVSDGVRLSDCSNDEQERCDIIGSLDEVGFETPTIEHTKLAMKLPQTLQYESFNPSSNATPYYGIKMDLETQMVGTSASLVRFVQEDPEERKTFELQGVCQHEKTKEEGSGCDWENLISDAAELLISDASTESEKTQSFDSLGSCNPQAAQNLAIHLGDVGVQNGADNSSNLISNAPQNKKGIDDLSKKMDGNVGDCMQIGCEVDIQQQRGLPRRCLFFEVSGAHSKRLEDDSQSYSPNSSQSDGKFASDDKQLVPPKPGIGPSPCMLPGIGLHLNSLATTSKACRIVKQEILFSGRQLISMPKSVGSFHSIIPGQKSLSESLALNPIERDLDPRGNELHVMEDASQASGFGAGEEFNQSSPKKKRRRLENGGESEAACKRCNCKKSKCLKLYCECFAAGVYCVEVCSCQECFNKPVHEDTVLATRKQIESRNPLAFAPKVIRRLDPVPDPGEEVNKTPASARHKRGCNCKKSSCLKKYCECYQGDVGCSSNCRCEGCKNTFGRKDGTAPIGIDDAELEEEESEACEKNGLNETPHFIEVQKDGQQYPEGVLNITPLHSKLPAFSSGKPPRSSLLTVGSSPQLKACQKLRKSEFSHLQPNLEKHFQITKEDETPDILRGNCSPVNGVKTVSPNRKRVSPPHNEFGLSPGQKSSRKLILQSIPSFPSLTPHPGTSDFPVKLQ